MHRIDTSTAKNGKFTDGNPHKPKEEYPTQLNASWFNAVQENICTAIEGQGILLEKGNVNQLYQAMVASSYRYQILSHLSIMTDFLRPVSDEIILPDEVSYNSDVLKVLNQVIDALDHISDEAKIPNKPESLSDIDSIVEAINILIPGIERQSERILGLTPILKKGN